MLTGTQRRTCSDKCRSARSRRLKARYKREQEAEVESSDIATREMQRAVRNQLDDQIHKVMRDELRPIVRENLTEDVIRSISALLGLMPEAVQALMEDLTQTDSYDRRQRAYTLLMKYTAGNSPLVPSVDPSPPAVNIIMPGLTDVVDETTEPDEADVVEDSYDFICNACDRELEDAKRAAPGADRCKECHAALQERKNEILAGTKRA